MGGRVALVNDDQRMTYAQLDNAASRVAHALVDAGIRTGDKVALSCLNVPWFSVAYFGILETGAVVVPLNALLKAREIAHHLTDSDAVAFICCEGNDQLPMAYESWVGFQDVAGCTSMWIATAAPSVPSPASPRSARRSAISDQPEVFPSRTIGEDD